MLRKEQNAKLLGKYVNLRIESAARCMVEMQTCLFMILRDNRPDCDFSMNVAWSEF